MNSQEVISKISTMFPKSEVVAGESGTEVKVRLSLSESADFFRACRAEDFFPNPRFVFYVLDRREHVYIRIDEAYSGNGILAIVDSPNGEELPSVREFWPAAKWHEREAESERMEKGPGAE